ncbi:MAG: hypothetical protein KME08_00885 [Aphanothece sp. CMT-3BRIN-NPC111]|jgi:hypothetical protein|nr:hypothetical protein [Aphanothece sp. CMT-3BRIN-NPC111]
MSTPIIFVDHLLAQAPAKKPQAQTNANKPQPSQSLAASPSSDSQAGQIWMFTSIALLLLLVGLAVYGKRKVEQLTKKAKLEEYKNRDVQKKLKLALETIRKMETNPDLVHSRDFNLDYLRMRMDEKVFNFAIVNQIKIKVKQIISVSLRPNEGSQAVIGIANTSGRQVDETFDVMYEMEHGNKRTQRVLFRIQIKLTKLPTQSSNSTIAQIIDCIEKFLSASEDHDSWQPTIQGRIAVMDWDQKAKPTPLLVLAQSSEGANVNFRTKPNKRAV